MMESIILKPGREKSVLRRHPWVFSGAIAEVHGTPSIGDTVEIRDSRGDFLAIGAYSPLSQIRIRIWQWDEVDFEPELFFRRKIAEALCYREKCGVPHNHDNSARRLVYAESDQIPGLIVDQYNQNLVVQILSAGPERWRDIIFKTIYDLTGIKDIYERSDDDIRQLEGLPARVGTLRGSPAETVVITEGGLKFNVAIKSGHKTGFYLDQRSNRQIVRNLSVGRDVLDCFCYSGGFTINALVGGAKSVTAVDASREALRVLEKNVPLNLLPSSEMVCEPADVFQQLRKYRDQGRTFDMIILDPPKFAPTTSQIRKASRGYKDINLLAMKLIRPGGYLVTFSCSGGVEPALFQKIVADAALDAAARVRIISHLEQAPDHPVASNFPEGAYLKGLLLYAASSES